MARVSAGAFCNVRKHQRTKVIAIPNFQIILYPGKGMKFLTRGDARFSINFQKLLINIDKYRKKLTPGNEKTRQTNNFAGFVYLLVLFLSYLQNLLFV